MKFQCKVIKLICLFVCAVLIVHAQENASKSLPPSLRECYENKYLLERDNRLPHTLETFIAILRKIENVDNLNMDLKSLSVALLHRFRQDGVTANPSIPSQDGVTPYAPNTFQYFRFKQTLRLIPGNAQMFPNNNITDIERCTLHFILSSSVEIFQRGDEENVCRSANMYRYPRAVDHNNVTTQNTIRDVETLSFDEIRNMTHHTSEGHATIDPNSLYPELPPNHPDNAQMFALPPLSKCPIENGVMKTSWGDISPGLVLAGIAAALQPETPMLYDLQPDILQKNNTNLQDLSLDNTWIATLAGDLAEVALRQGPKGNKLSIGVMGSWNSTALPKWYFLNSNEKYDMTTAEIRGDLDGLTLANEIQKWYSRIPSLRLSQIFDMYYSSLGLFNSSIRACNRRTFFTYIAPNETMVKQTYSAALLLYPYITHATLHTPKVIEKFSVQAVNELVTYVPSYMNNDLSCTETDRLYNINKISVDLTIILDTNWEFSAIKPMLAYLLSNIDINQYNSKFTIINSHDGSAIINSSSNILDFYVYNATYYQNITHGFDLAKSFKELEKYLMHKLDNERSQGIGGARSDVVLIIPYVNDISSNDKEYCLESISRMREHIPDTTFLIMMHGSRDTWYDLVIDPLTDLFFVSVGDTNDALMSINDVISRIEQVPKRLINTQCGSDYVSTGSSNSYNDYLIPNGINYYRLHPNYFYNGENAATIKIQGNGMDNLIVCLSRENLYTNATQASKSCSSIINAHSMTVSCSNAAYIHQCSPLYISITSNSSSTSYQCTDHRVCRYPNMIKYSISYENLVCTSGVITNTLHFLIPITISMFFMLL